MLRRMARWFGLSVVVAVLLLAAFAFYLRHPSGDPIAVLPQNQEPVRATLLEEFHEDDRLIQRHRIEDPALGEVGLVVSLPEPLPEQPLPLVVVLGGLGSGLSTIRQLPPAGDNIVVGYDWPLPDKLPRGVDFLRQGPALYERVLTVPGQIAAVIAWAAAQPWAEPDRISLLTFSLGAMAAPAAQRLLQAQGGQVAWTVLAYGGADLGSLAESHPRIRRHWVSPLVGWIADFYFGPLDPAVHLPHLSGRFLVIGGEDDGLVPEDAARLMEELAPEPKRVVRLVGDHIGVGGGQEALMAEILAVVESWLKEQGAVNPR